MDYMASKTDADEVSLANADQLGLLADRTTTFADEQDFTLDRNWTKQAFLLSDSELGDNTNDIRNRYWSSASVKFTDTRLAGNIGVNSRPQFTRYSDIRVRGRLAGRSDVSLSDVGGNYGMGRYYSEAIDDNSQTIYLRCGVPQFNSLLGFFTNAFDSDWVTMARTGRSPGWLSGLGAVAGSLTSFSALPRLSAIIFGGRAVSWFFGAPTSKFYTLKPTMHMYWSAVNMLVNTIAVNSGILPPLLANENGQRVQDVYKLDQDLMEALRKLMPDVITENYGFDAFAFANKAQRLSNQLTMNLYEAADKASPTDYVGLVKKEMGSDDRVSNEIYSKDDSGIIGSVTGILTLPAWVDKTLRFGYYKSEEAKGESPKTEMKPNIDPKTGEEKQGSWWQQFGNYFDAELRAGSQFAVFKVNHTGAINESFTNTTVESQLSHDFNSVSSKAREARFMIADGNIVGGPVGSLLSTIGSSISDVASGFLSGATFGLYDALKGLAGGGFVDIPEHYQSSSAKLPTASYTMELISPYGNALSRLQNIYIPLCMILATVLPISTGKASYTSPFLVQLFDQGRCQIQLGIVDSVSITRGTTNLPFNKRGKPLSMEVKFTVKDLSSILHMPVSTGGLFGALGDVVQAAVGVGGNHNATTDSDNILQDYLAVLAGQDMYTQIYPMARGRLRLAKLLVQNERLISPAYWAGAFYEASTTGMLKYITGPAVSILEALVSESAVATRDR